MNRSESIGKLAEALAKAQGAIEGAKKDKANPFFKSKYADLASVWDACREPLSANGLSVVQLPEMNETGVTLTTVLLHSSGESLSGVLSAPIKGEATAQAIGSLVTYLRRYSLAAIVGVAPDEDDDGNAASGRTAPSVPAKTNHKPAQPPASQQTIAVGATLPPEEQLFIRLTELLPEAFISKRDKEAWQELHRAEVNTLPLHLKRSFVEDFGKIAVKA